MIEESIGYKFRDHLKETVLYEDQVVEHILTGHIAERRVFPKRLSQDKVAQEIVEKQLHLAASVEHPNLPSVFGATTTHGQYLYIQQHFEGETLELLAQRKNAQKAKDWAEIAIRLVDLCSDLQFHGVAFDRLSLRDVILSNRMLLINRRYPVGKTSEEAQKESPYLQRLFESDTSGIYHSEGRFPTQSCLKNLKEMLFQLACSKRHQSIDEAREFLSERSRASGQKQFSQFGIELPIEELILRLDESGNPKAIRSIDELKVALRDFEVDKQAPSIKAAAKTDSKQVVQEKAEPQKESPKSEDLPFVSSTSSEKNLKKKSAIPEPSVEDIEKRESKMVGHNIDDDAEEDRSYLYPSSGKSSKSDSESSGKSNSRTSLDSVNTGAYSASKSRRRSGSMNIPWGIIIGILLFGGVIYGGISIIPLVINKKNTTPIAVIDKTGQQNVPIQEFVILDATGSTDEEEDNLTYSWSLPNVEDDTDYLLQELDNDKSRIQIKFFRPGIYPIQLVVFDGRLRSEPAHVMFEAYSP